MSLTREDRNRRIGSVFRVATGNFLEQYDFFVYGIYAAYIGRTFFPTENEFASLMASLGAFAISFLMRPLGAIVLGAYIDRHGRRQGLIVTLALMALGTLTLALTPGYATIGVAAPIIIVLGRLLQGFSAGAELGGVSVYLAEIATPGRRGFYTSWQSGSQQVAVVFAALLGALLSVILSPADMAAWGWRVPLLIGCAIIPIILWLRRSLEETEEFRRMEKAKRTGELLLLLRAQWALVVAGLGLVATTTTLFYFTTIYTPTFGSQALHLDPTSVLGVTVCIGLSNLVWLPVGGSLSDRFGRIPLLVLVPILAIVTAYPALAWLASAPSFGKLLAVELMFSAFFGLYNGAMIPHLTEIIPPQIRTAGFSLAYSLATAIFGGVTPLVSTYLIQVTGSRAAPALWLAAAGAISLVAALASRRYAVPAGRATTPASARPGVARSPRR
ncbi:MFS transporter [Lichenibacterium ramalinae]|uniref:MFS transporter n=1 Tax=Lichenibacterium ramalinae TaxID=2316527 RepID=A0A4Q2RLB2_9HYPH|nr:MFS transporter [Lichenibacterium ramalinae]RYB07621.1 MFS transporter [Lichenibacterium ramalinae]